LEEKHHINKKAMKGEVGWEARERWGGRPGRGGEGAQGEGRAGASRAASPSLAVSLRGWS